MNTQGWLTQAQPNTDAQIFIDLSEGVFQNGGAAPAAVMGATGLLGSIVPAAQALMGISKQISGLMLRTGMLQSTNYATNTSQQAFGTANGPGPSSVAGTSGPLGLGALGSRPPILNANLPTLTGSKSGAVAKGIQINWVDVIYQILGGAVTGTFTFAMTQATTPVGEDVATTVSSVILTTTLIKTVNSASNKVHRTRFNNANAAMLVTDGTTLLPVVNVTTPAGVTVGVAGLIFGCNYNFN